MKRILFFLTASVLFYSEANFQTTEDSVNTTVNQLSAILQSVGRSKEGKTVIENDKIDDFAKSISQIKKGAADEQIVFETIKIDGPLAMVWAPYKFYFDGNFSHCGVDCFQLVRINGAWKIQYLLDTRRKQPCN